MLALADRQQRRLNPELEPQTKWDRNTRVPTRYSPTTRHNTSALTDWVVVQIWVRDAEHLPPVLCFKVDFQG